MKPLTVVCAVCDADRDQAIRLFEWIGDMEEPRPVEFNQYAYQLLILDTASYGSVGMMQVEEQAKRCFSKRTFCGQLPVAPWPQGPNASFLMTCKLVTTPFLWLEPDCVPMRNTWLAELCDEYYAQAKPFMGTIVRTSEEQLLDVRYDVKMELIKLPSRHMTGVGIYPAYAKEFYHESFGDKPWDLFAASQILPFVHDTKLIWHFYGEHGLPPTFVDQKASDSPRNAIAFDFIPKKACLMHRQKDGSLISLLRKRL